MLTYTLKSVNAFKPTKRSFNEVGYEIYSSEDKRIPAKGRNLVATDLCFNFPVGYCGLLISIPELAAEQNVDVGYSTVKSGSESINVLLINNSDVDLYIFKGNKIAMMLIQKFYDSIFIIEIPNHI